MAEQPLPSTPSKEKHVTELAGPDDAWLSVTDASRVARRQEHTIRTWIRDGLLSVHPERTGLNKRTRRVRLSDLAILTPILDIEAAIATEVGQLDLVSIPRQQQQIKQEHDHLQAEQRHIRDLLAVQEQEHHRHIADMRAVFEQRLAEEQQRHTEALADVVATQNAHIAELRSDVIEMNAWVSGALDGVHRQFDEHQQRHAEFRAEILGHLQHDRQTTTQRIDDLQALLTQEVAALRQTQTDAIQHMAAVVEEHAALSLVSIREMRQEMEVQTQRQTRETDDALQALNAEVAADLADMTGRIEEQGQATLRRQEYLATQLDVARSAALGAQSRLDTQHEVLQALRSQLLEEQQAREVLAQQVAALATEKGKVAPGKQRRKTE